MHKVQTYGALKGEHQMEEKNPIQVSERIFQTIETLAQTGPIGLLALSKELSLNKSTLHRILNSLICLGYVQQDAETSKYSLSFKLCDLANQLLGRIDAVELAKPSLKRLAAQTGETVHLVQLDGIHAVYIDKVESYANSVRLVSKVGKRIPLYCSGVGKALLSAMEEGKVSEIWENSQILPLTEHTITEYAALLGQLQQVRKLGYALDLEENEVGVRCIAAGIRNYTGKTIYAFSISAPSSRMSDEAIGVLAGKILETQAQLEKALGGS